MRRLKRAHQRYIRQEIKRRNKFRQGALAAGAAAAITLGAGVSLNKVLAQYIPKSHELGVSKDADVDLLTDKEEFAIGYKPFNDDQNKNEIPDGVELAKRCFADINELPVWDEQGEVPKEIYKIEILLRGLETCDICGTTVNMGGVVIVNPALNLTYPEPGPEGLAYLPYISLYYMEHGSFSYAGDVHGKDRPDIPALLRTLELRFPYEPDKHQLPLDYIVGPIWQPAPDSNDLDGDLLADSEELAAGSNLHDCDQDNDLTPDGIELAKQCAEIIDALPEWDLQGDPPTEGTYKANYFQRGSEMCDVCGELVNMGYWQIVNTESGLSIDVPDITCHYMTHGSFSYAGSIHGKGRIDVGLLVKILQMPRRCGDLGTVYLPGDLNEDCSENFKDIAAVADKWLDCTDPSQD